MGYISKLGGNKDDNQQKFKLGQEINTPANTADPNADRWIVTGTHLQFRPGKPVRVLYQLRLLNSTEDKDIACSYFSEEELVAVKK